MVTSRDAVMFSLYLIAIAVGAMIMQDHDPLMSLLGLIQVVLVAFLFGLRLRRCFAKRT